MKRGRRAYCLNTIAINMVSGTIQGVSIRLESYVWLAELKRNIFRIDNDGIRNLNNTV